MPTVLSAFNVHSALLSNPRNGGAEWNFVYGSKQVLEKSSTFTNPRLQSITSQYAIATFRLQDGKRYLLHVTSMDLPENEGGLENAVRHFMKVSFETIVDRCRNNNRKNGEAYSVYTVTAGYRVALQKFANLVFKDAASYDDVVFEQAGSIIVSYKREDFGKPSSVKSETSTSSTPSIIPMYKDKKIPLAKVSNLTQRGDVFVQDGDWEIMLMAEAISKVKTAANILFIGLSGTGKTSIPEAFAKERKMDVFMMNCAAVRDPEEWFGRREAAEGTTYFKKSDFIKAVEKGNTVVIMDEFNRVEPFMHNTLFPLLDHRRETIIDNEVIKVGKGTIFVATANLGVSFTGTFMVDAALANRFNATVVTTFLNHDVEVELLKSRVELDDESATVIVRVVNEFRNMVKSGIELPVDVSTRTSLKIAEMVKYSRLPFRKVLDSVIFSFVEDKGVVKQMNDKIAHIIS